MVSLKEKVGGSGRRASRRRDDDGLSSPRPATRHSASPSSASTASYSSPGPCSGTPHPPRIARSRSSRVVACPSTLAAPATTSSTGLGRALKVVGWGAVAFFFNEHVYSVATVTGRCVSPLPSSSSFPPLIPLPTQVNAGASAALLSRADTVKKEQLTQGPTLSQP